MSNFNPHYAAVFLLCAMGLWGCSQQKSGAIGAKIRDLETRYAKLDEDFKTLQFTSEQHRKRLSQSETQRAALEKDKAELARQVDHAVLDRENFRKQLSQRTLERDHAQANLTQFGKDLQALAGRVETALNSQPSSPQATIIPASRRIE